MSQDVTGNNCDGLAFKIAKTGQICHSCCMIMRQIKIIIIYCLNNCIKLFKCLFLSKNNKIEGVKAHHCKI